MKTKTKNLIICLIVSIVASIVPAIIFGKWLEAIIFQLCHWPIREQYPLQYHHIVPAICRIVTANVMFFGVSFVLPLELSLISAIPICYFVSWVGFVKKTSDINEVRVRELKEQLEKFKDKLTNTPKQELIDKCHKAKLSKRDTEIAELYYIEKWKPKEIWLWVCQHKEYDPIDWDSVHQVLWRIGNKIK
jgi:hypothetical protein